MSSSDIKSTDPDHFLPPNEDEEPFTLRQDWTKKEEARAKRK
jgi:hypothetical protein